MELTSPAAAGDAASYEALFRPRSVALVGATDRSRWSVQTFTNLRRYSPHVRVHLVTPRGGVVHGAPAVTSLGELAEPVDLVYVMTPRETVAGVLRDAATVGARAAIVLTAGFGESEDGVAHQRELVEAARDAGILLVGPNGNGIVNLHDDVAAFGLALPEVPSRGPASFVLQSGGLVKPLLGLAEAWGVGVGTVVCTGNEASTTAADLAGAMLEDPRTGSVGLFLETVRDTESFRAMAHRALELDKPVVALTIGRSEVAQRTAQAHTGALAGDAAVASAVLRSLGVIQVRSLEELVATTDLLARGFRPAGRRLAVVGASGGACELVAERATEVGLAIPALTERGRAALAEILPDISQAQNPLDVTGFATVDPALPIRALDAVSGTADGVYDAVLFQAFVLPRDEVDDEAATRAHYAEIADAVRASAIPVLLQDEAAAPVSGLARDVLTSEGLVRLPGVDLGLAAVAHAATWVERRAALTDRELPAPAPLDLPAPTSRGQMSEAEVLALLDAAGVPVVPHTLASGRDEAARAATRWPRVALKVCSADVPHKSDVGGVVLGVSGVRSAAEAYDRVLGDVRAAVPAARIDGVLVSPMRDVGLELIVGAHHDPVWGPVLLVGIGGVLVEVLGDVVLRPLPVSEADVGEMLDELRGTALLRGVRGRRPVDRAALVGAITSFARLAESLGDTYQSMEINPLRADAEAVEALDALVVWAPRDAGPATRRNT